MPTTRSSTRTVATNESQEVVADLPSITQKRKAETPGEKASKKSRSGEGPESTSNVNPAANVPQVPQAATTASPTAFVPAVLTFSFEEAKEHLILVDNRFEDLFRKMKCKPFEHLERVHPFRALTTSILGQQISWLAARSIVHKFRRMYDPTLPEKATDQDDGKSLTSSFPTPEQVAGTDIATLRTAGLSIRKAEYVQDLAARFADGRLSTEKLINANDEELAQILIEVRGIGRWTVDMFAIFSLRRSDILPVGDLGVQRGLVRWFLSLHSPTHSYSLSPEKVASTSKKTKTKAKTNAAPAPSSEEADVLPIPGESSSSATQDVSQGLYSDLSSVPPVSNLEEGDGDPEGITSLPPTFTPSIKKTLNKPAKASGRKAIPLPEGLTVSDLKSRLEGKKKIKGAFLTPQEMTALTESWKPYRSIGVYYMWSLADATE